MITERRDAGDGNGDGIVDGHGDGGNIETSTEIGGHGETNFVGEDTDEKGEAGGGGGGEKEKEDQKDESSEHRVAPVEPIARPTTTDTRAPPALVPPSSVAPQAAIPAPVDPSASVTPNARALLAPVSQKRSGSRRRSSSLPPPSADFFLRMNNLYYAELTAPKPRTIGTTDHRSAEKELCMAAPSVAPVDPSASPTSDARAVPAPVPQKRSGSRRRSSSLPPPKTKWIAVKSKKIRGLSRGRLYNRNEAKREERSKHKSPWFFMLDGNKTPAAVITELKGLIYKAEFERDALGSNKTPAAVIKDLKGLLYKAGFERDALGSNKTPADEETDIGMERNNGGAYKKIQIKCLTE